MELQQIGFYTLHDERAKNSSVSSSLQRCELLLTSGCNFKCPYCRGLKNPSTLEFEQAKNIIDKWASHGLVNIRFSGGEPTLVPYLRELVAYTKERGIKRIAISTNGSASKLTYERLYHAGVNDFSISLDACCSSTCDKMTGRKGEYKKILNNIKYLSSLTYVTVGIVLTNNNVKELSKIVRLSKSLGVSDIRIISAAQQNEILSKTSIKVDEVYPIFSYRVKNLKNGSGVRGLSASDNDKCPLALDDMAVWNNEHYPCIIYLREGGNPIGSMNSSIEKIRKDRAEWASNHNTHKNIICSKNCLDVCRDYNNRWKEFHQ